MKKPRWQLPTISIMIISIVAVIVLFFISFFLGRYPISPLTVIKVFASKILPIPCTWSSNVEIVIFQVRLPRLIAAMLVGAGLSISGASFQGLFKNPLVAPNILGVASGAGFGAALAILLSGNVVVTYASAFAFGTFAVILAYNISRSYKITSPLVLALSGIVVAALFEALIGITKFVADPYEKLPAITFWLMGSLASISTLYLAIAVLLIIPGIIVLLLIRWRLNILAMGDEEAQALGLNIKKLRTIILTCATVITASAVCMCGIVGWIGLVIPHVCRLLIGPDHRKLLPLSLPIGAAYLLIVDNVARTLTIGEIPLGILTAIIGAPLFTYLLMKFKVSWV